MYDFSQTMNNWHEYERKKKKYKENTIYLSPQVDFFPSDVSLFYDNVVFLKYMKQHLNGCKYHVKRPKMCLEMIYFGFERRNVIHEKMRRLQILKIFMFSLEYWKMEF